MTSPVLAASGLVKRFGGFTANDGVDIAVGAGEIRGIIGPNGAGKTTLVNLITGVERPNAGEILLGGSPIGGLAPDAIAARGLVRSFQVARVFGDMSLVENLLVPYLARRGRLAEGEARARELIGRANLARLADAPAKTLSGGQRVLLQVTAGFMCPQLSVYVLDEPFAGVNPVIKDTILELIATERRERNVTFVVVSHEMDIMRRLCDRITVMVEGRVLLEGTLEEVASDPRVVAAYLGKPLR